MLNLPAIYRASYREVLMYTRKAAAWVGDQDLMDAIDLALSRIN